MDIVLVQGRSDVDAWCNMNLDLDYTKVHFFDVYLDGLLYSAIQSDSDALVHRYAVAPVAWRTGSDALHKCLQILHNACAVESHPSGWAKICPAS